MYRCIFILFHMFYLWIVYNYIVCILLYFFYLLFIGLYMIYLCSFCSARFLGVYIMQMLAYMRVCISSMIVRDEYILWAFCGDKLPHMTLSIKCTMSIIQSFCVHGFPLFIAFLMCFHLVFAALNAPPPYFPAGVSRLVTPLSPAQKFLIWGEGKRAVSNLWKNIVFYHALSLFVKKAKKLSKFSRNDFSLDTLNSIMRV